MNCTVLDWLERMREAAESGHFAQVLVMRDRRSSERLFDVDDEADFEDLTTRIHMCCLGAASLVQKCRRATT